MPYMKNGKRDYARELKWDHAHPNRVHDRVARNQARAELMKEGVVHKGDGKDVDHKTPLSKGGSQARSNLRAVDASANRSFKRDSNSNLVSQESSRERRPTSGRKQGRN